MKKNSGKKKAERAKNKIKVENDVPSPVKWPDFAARGKKILGKGVLNAVEDFLKYRHRHWEQ